jgi:hypothetical protein
MAKRARLVVPTTDDEWQRRSTAAAIAAARDMITKDDVIRLSSAVGRLTDAEWGWIVAAVLFGWIKTRAEQATSEGIEKAIRFTGAEHEPWDIGAIASILPELAAQAPVNWSVPVGAWSKDDMLAMLNTAFRLMRRAMAARDFGEKAPASEDPGVVANVLSREANAGVNNPLMTPKELNDAIPF